MGEGGPAEGTEDDPAALKVEISTLLGRCMLGLQSYEVMLKVLVAEGAFDGTPDAIVKRRSKRRASVEGATMGGLVTQFIGSTLVEDVDSIPSDEDQTKARQGNHVSFRYRIAFPPEALPEVERGLKELVVLRNHLVHGFVAAHDFGSAAGCRRARDALLEAMGQIDRHRVELTDWLKAFDATKEQMRQTLRDPAVLQMIGSGEEGDVTVTLSSPQVRPA